MFVIKLHHLVAASRLISPTYCIIVKCLVKLLCIASLLKTDHVRLRGLSAASNFCPLCDHAAMDEPFYLTMQWLALQGARYDMFEELRVMRFSELRTATSSGDGVGELTHPLYRTLVY